MKKGKLKRALPDESVDEVEMFEGSENPLMMKQVYAHTFHIIIIIIIVIVIIIVIIRFMLTHSSSSSSSSSGLCSHVPLQVPTPEVSF